MIFTLTTVHIIIFCCLSSLYLICYGILFQRPEGIKLPGVLQLFLLPVSFMPHAHFELVVTHPSLSLSEFAHGRDLDAQPS